MTDQPNRQGPGFASQEPSSSDAPAFKRSGGNGMLAMKVIGWLMFAYGAVMLILLFSPAKDWALNHSIAALVSRTDRRVGNTVDGPGDEPIAIAGSAVVMFAGLWFALLVPWVMSRSRGKMEAIIEESQRERELGSQDPGAR